MFATNTYPQYAEHISFLRRKNFIILDYFILHRNISLLSASETLLRSRTAKTALTAYGIGQFLFLYEFRF